ncbi:phosphoribosylamine--glycine ligase [Enterococcus saccharolyticus]|uniref:Phosphoribosylamine--glycine ligase n=1 Tax=Enterococcus saccharolyticus subsp. saccharolyticus ATCC 43076 TaxID=1139996 RepID=S0JMG9_9ENTE|nr:phosphoribosylamine--glycine ligase [Enterococcus saccharolyticus]EOT29725.1 phosphoribosylamine-glycine ligase [Enterococcus saccharolyticus subsp. saccharolyticus ATCC 43076]EOT80885.1 phosphoribosylamine-glycine ligase [Enterococcus saccharolyticus subsp. saccharolyticus ATCC 43076]OJG89655.1 phosphoribosylamine-glycine ligase [Enterococcus saccharolyticus]
MKILVIGSGGREHAIAKKFLSDSAVTAVFCAKGNPGMTRDGIQLVDIAEDNHERLIEFAKNQAIDWTFVGPEIPLLNGIVDDFQQAGLQIFGPKKAAAMIEGSKEFAKELMVNNQIPTAAYQSFSDFETAKSYVLEQGAPIVIKADGLAAGKGVVVAETIAEAIAALKEMLEDNKFGASGAKVVIEEFLAGEEFSLLAFVREEKVYPMVIAQDHKRAFDGDRGPNTGGMGAYSPVPQISEEIVEQAVQEVLLPAAQGMVAQGTPFTGILYAGLIATKNGPKVIEFNARFGDPETQVVLPRLDSSLAAIITALLKGEEPEIQWNNQATLGVVVAAQGYPGTYVTGQTIPEFISDDCHVYYAGVAEERGLVSAGGRVLLVEAQAQTLEQAQQKVYQLLNQVELPQLFYRHDIGNKAL